MARFIWPTTRGWVLGLGGIAWLLVAMVNHALIALLIGWAMLCLTGASLASALLSLYGFRIRRGPADQATAGQMLDMSLEIENPKWRRRQAIVLEEKLPFALVNPLCSIVPPVRRHSQLLFSRPVLAVHRGSFKLSPLTLRGGDPAGLFYRETTLSLPASIIVYPPVEPLPDLLLHQHETVQTTSHPISAAGTSQDFFGVREYTHSDGMRYIHWRSSARFGKFMVKEFERNAVMSAAVLLDGQEQLVSDNSWSNLEYLIRAAASISHHCSGLYCNFSFVAGGATPTAILPKAASEAHQEVMYSLATMKPGNARLHTLLEDFSRALPDNTVIFCLSLSADNLHLRQALEALVCKGMDVRWFCANKRDFAVPKKKRSIEEPREPSAKADSLVTPVRLAPEMSLSQALTVITP